MRSVFSRQLTWLLAVVMLMSLSACGFALRGPVSFPFKSIYIGLPEASSLGGELKRQIRANGQTQITADAKDAEVILDVLSETREKQILSLNSQGRVREYNLLYNFRFRLRNAVGKEYLEPVTVQLKRTITFNEAQVLAKESEEALLYRDMQSDLVQQIMRRLSVVKMDQ
ncbi:MULTISPECIES: LPS assembly lipoprotein LptE [unclassified Undibacterium]|uniref:LPS-assembly lipoprotein LptE n=1 Tax=unclassified Undibacterium TaxID=2630295 RepID=UPI003C2BE99F